MAPGQEDEQTPRDLNFELALASVPKVPCHSSERLSAVINHIIQGIQDKGTDIRGYVILET